jgi:hypothetical protein
MCDIVFVQPSQNLHIAIIIIAKCHFKGYVMHVDLGGLRRQKDKLVAVVMEGVQRNLLHRQVLIPEVVNSSCASFCLVKIIFSFIKNFFIYLVFINFNALIYIYLTDLIFSN